MGIKANLKTIIGGCCIGLIAGCLFFDGWLVFVYILSDWVKPITNDDFGDFLYPELCFYGIDSISVAFYGIFLPAVSGGLGAIISAYKTPAQYSNDSHPDIYIVTGAVMMTITSLLWYGYCISNFFIYRGW